MSNKSVICLSYIKLGFIANTYCKYNEVRQTLNIFWEQSKDTGQRSPRIILVTTNGFLTQKACQGSAPWYSMLSHHL